MSLPQTIVFDTDPGLDDAIALLLALAYPDALRVAAVTTVAGNQSIAKVTDNALRLLSFAQTRVTVAAGAVRPLVKDLASAAHIHGETGLGSVRLPTPSFAADPRSAVEVLADVVRTNPEPVTVVSVGPSTNLALFLNLHPDLAGRLGRVSLMGGSLSAGNRTPAAEFNVWTDPEAAAVLFGSGVPLVMAGLDVTHRAYITLEEVARLEARGPASRLVAALIRSYGGRFERVGLPGSAIHDACSVAYLLRPELFTGQDLRVEVETSGAQTRGMTVADRRPGTTAVPNAFVLLDVDRPGFIDLLFDALGILDRRLGS